MVVRRGVRCGGRRGVGGVGGRGGVWGAAAWGGVVGGLGWGGCGGAGCGGRGGSAREEPSEAQTSGTDPGSSVGAARSAGGGCRGGRRGRDLSGQGQAPRTVFPTLEQAPGQGLPGARAKAGDSSVPSLVWRRREERGSREPRRAGLGPTRRPSALSSAQEEAGAAAPALKSCSGRWATASKSLAQDNCQR